MSKNELRRETDDTKELEEQLQKDLQILEEEEKRRKERQELRKEKRINAISKSCAIASFGIAMAVTLISSKRLELRKEKEIYQRKINTIEQYNNYVTYIFSNRNTKESITNWYNFGSNTEWCRLHHYINDSEELSFFELGEQKGNEIIVKKRIPFEEIENNKAENNNSNTLPLSYCGIDLLTMINLLAVLYLDDTKEIEKEKTLIKKRIKKTEF